MIPTIARRRTRVALAALTLPIILVSACGGTTTATTTTTNPTVGSVTPDNAASAAVLPVAGNPITSTSTNNVLTIDNVLVENNVDPGGKAASDHLEFTITNKATSPAKNVEVYYRFDDATAGVSEGYFTRLPTSFEIPAGGKRTVHFDDTSATDHFPVNKFSLYYTSKNALAVAVTVSASDAAAAAATIQKDPGGAEAPD